MMEYIFGDGGHRWLLEPAVAAGGDGSAVLVFALPSRKILVVRREVGA